MGGNALAGLQTTRRYNKDEYFALIPEVVQLVGLSLPGNRIEVIQAYREKETFGDMDVLIELLPEQLDTFRDNLCNNLNVKAIYSDGKPQNKYKTIGSSSMDKVYTVAYKELQIDFILVNAVPVEAFDAAFSYFSWNDLGNLLGRVAHSFGFKLGHAGLLYPFTVNDHNFEELLVTYDWDQILPAFGWDPERYAQGFNTTEEIFEYVASSEFFNPDIFLLENRNAKARYRDQKRQTYSDFLEWCERHKARLPRFSYPSTKAELLPTAFERLRLVGFKDKYEKVETRYAKYCQFKEKFNGGLVKELTGLEGRELGSLMEYIRGKGPEIHFQDWILGSDEKRIARMILAFHKGWITNDAGRKIS